MSATHHGLALVSLGRPEEGIAQMQHTLTRENRTMADVDWIVERYLLALAFAKIGRSAEGLTVVVESLSRLDQGLEESGFKTDFCRLKGDLLMMGNSPPEDEAKELYHRAIELARGDCDKTAELQATTSLTRLLTRSGLRDEARAILAGIYNWFTEGYDTADLREAKALLDGLSL
jgi:hypothetical protein